MARRDMRMLCVAAGDVAKNQLSDFVNCGDRRRSSIGNCNFDRPPKMRGRSGGLRKHLFHSLAYPSKRCGKVGHRFGNCWTGRIWVVGRTTGMNESIPTTDR